MSTNEFSTAFSTAYDPPNGGTSMDICYPEGTDWGCALNQQQIDSLDPDVKERSEALAWSTLSALLGYRVSLCPVVLRPCLAGCGRLGTYYSAPESGGGGTFQPHISAGRWYNGCGCTTDCSCTSLCEVVMPAPVGAIVSVSLNGATLDPSAYRVDNGNRLVRTDGDCWPACQDMTSTGEGSFIVSFHPYLAPNDLLRYAAGLLANEFYLACTGEACRLPSGVTGISRNGISMTIPSGLFPNGGTGIREIDAIIRTYNPNGLKMSARVLSPDATRGRVQTWA
jgi:hypothetical protein